MWALLFPLLSFFTEFFCLDDNKSILDYKSKGGGRQGEVVEDNSSMEAVIYDSHGKTVREVRFNLFS